MLRIVKCAFCGTEDLINPDALLCDQGWFLHFAFDDKIDSRAIFLCWRHRQESEVLGDCGERPTLLCYNTTNEYCTECWWAQECDSIILEREEEYT